jgi:RNA-directed DNA polymerase
VEPMFHPDSYGYRPDKSALDAVGQARQRCWRNDWVVDLDIKGFFDNIDHGLLMRALRKHTDSRWVLLYVKRWLKAPVVEVDGVEYSRDRGTPQGGVISPLLANVFLHYVLDTWMEKSYPTILFERYADDAVYHCKTKKQAQFIQRALEERLQQCGLQAHPEKTRIVYCKDSTRGGAHEHIAFDFLGYQFRPRKAKDSHGELFVSFSPGCSPKALKRMGKVLRSWILNCRTDKSLNELARFYNAVIRGWIQYYGVYYKTALRPLLQRVNRYLVRWAQRKYKRFRRHQRRAAHWLRRIARRETFLFPHWQLGVIP